MLQLENIPIQPVFRLSDGPVVLASLSQEYLDRDRIVLVTSVEIRRSGEDSDERVTTVRVGLLHGVVGEYPIESGDIFQVKPHLGMVVFTSRGRQYTVRAIKDSDAQRFLKREDASAKELEEAVMMSARGSNL